MEAGHTEIMPTLVRVRQPSSGGSEPFEPLCGASWLTCAARQRAILISPICLRWPLMRGGGSVHGVLESSNAVGIVPPDQTAVAGGGVGRQPHHV